MNTRQTSPASAEVAPTTGFRGWVRAWADFWFAPADSLSLTVVRVCTGLLLLVWLAQFAGDPEAYFGLQGWFDRKAFAQTAGLAERPPVPITWSVFYLCGDNSAAVVALYWAILAVVLLFTLGVVTRLTGVLTWVGVASCVANPATSYDGDVLLVLLTFYLAVGYLLKGQWGERLAWWERVVGPRHHLLGVVQCLMRRRQNVQPPVEQSVAANLALRLIQVHFAIVILVSGLHKLQMAEWCSGVAFWYPLHDPFTTTAASLRAEAPNADRTLVYLSLAQYAVLAWQIGFPFFAWRRAWRRVLLGGAALGWVGCAAVLNLPLFGPAFLIAGLSFVSGEELRRWVGWLPLFRRQAPPAAVPAAEVRGKRSEAVLAR